MHIAFIRYKAGKILITLDWKTGGFSRQYDFEIASQCK